MPNTVERVKAGVDKGMNIMSYLNDNHISLTVIMFPVLGDVNGS